MSDAHGYSADAIHAQLPRVLAEDERMHALAVAITEALAVRLGEIRLEEIYTRIDQLPESLLDILAVDFAIDWWDGNWSIDRKRQTVKDSWMIHKLLGTPSALAMAVQAAFGAGRAEEWFDYGGQAHHFRVVGLSLEMAQTGYAAFLRLLDIVKRESSVLDAVVMSSDHDQTLYAGCGLSCLRYLTIPGAMPPMEYAYIVDELGNILADEDFARYVDVEEE